MSRTTLQLLSLALVVCCLAATPSLAQVQQGEELAQEDNTLDQAGRAAPPSPEIAAEARFSTTVFCDLVRPSEVQRWNVVCSGGTQLDVQVADCCVPGDHFEAKSKAWDANPNTAVTTAPGTFFGFGVLSRVYTYGANVNVEVDCSYIHGTGNFPMTGIVNISSDATSCTVTNLGKRDSINRTP